MADPLALPLHEGSEELAMRWPDWRDPGGILLNGLLLALMFFVGAAFERWAI